MKEEKGITEQEGLNEVGDGRAGEGGSLRKDI